MSNGIKFHAVAAQDASSRSSGGQQNNLETQSAERSPAGNR